MARPTTKEGLLRAGGEGFNELFALIGSLTEEERESTFSFEDRDRNIRDVLAHLYEWHQLLLNWVESNRAGNSAGFLPEPYNWKTYPLMNVGFREKHRKTPLKDAAAMLKKSHSETMAMIASFSDEELFVKKYFPWTGTTNLGSYCVSATSSHYEWAVKKIGKHKKDLTSNRE